MKFRTVSIHHILGVFLLLTISGLVLLPGCKDESVTGMTSDIIFPIDNVSFSQHVQPLFNQGCALAGCHDEGPHPDTEVCLTSYFNTVFRTPGIVTPGKPELSTLVFSIEGTVGRRMPLNGPALTQNQINGIRTWIVEGAMNN